MRCLLLRSSSSCRVALCVPSARPCDVRCNSTSGLPVFSSIWPVSAGSVAQLGRVDATAVQLYTSRVTKSVPSSSTSTSASISSAAVAFFDRGMYTVRSVCTARFATMPSRQPSVYGAIASLSASGCEYASPVHAQLIVAVSLMGTTEHEAPSPHAPTFWQPRTKEARPLLKLEQLPISAWMPLSQWKERMLKGKSRSVAPQSCSMLTRVKVTSAALSDSTRPP
mmetsp:Transcript_28823/g.63122  ORF Transcript_28823/g.63122 Transcript_28823/m.63122 type:complete len:224 (+) Transcript_28823:476-1147(+)